MKTLVPILMSFLMTPAFAAEPMAVSVNRERLVLMQKILDSAVTRNLLKTYGEENFVFDGMSWVNTFDSFRYYDLSFKKFDLEVVEKDGQKEFMLVSLTCRHQIIVKSDQIQQGAVKGCQRSVEPMESVL